MFVRQGVRAAIVAVYTGTSGARYQSPLSAS
jgi:hypothetical protein